MKAHDWYWFRQMSGGFWVRRRGLGWRQTTKAHYESCITHPAIWQVLETENHSENDGLFGVVILALTVSSILLVAAIAGQVA